MKLYHFCANRHLESIMSEGLTNGSVLWVGGSTIKGYSGFQWLTSDPVRENQAWCNAENSTLPYDRCANRLTLLVPQSQRLIHFVHSRKILPIPKQAFDDLTFDGTEGKEWWLYAGSIPVEWIKKVEHLGERPEFLARAEAKT